MTAVPPPPSQPPTVGMPEPVVEWWRKSGPWNQRTAEPAFAAPQFTAEPVYIDLRKDTAPDTTPGAADAVEDQAVEDDDQEQADSATEAEQADDEDGADEDEADDDKPRTAGQSLREMISMTPQEQAEQAHLRRERAFRKAGETPEQREDRYRAEQIVQERRASVLWRQPHSERARRFRRWCILTAASGVAGYQMGLVTLAAHVPLVVATLGAGIGWGIDQRMRGWGHVRVSEVRGPIGITVLILVRVPFASALIGALGLAPLIALFSSTHH
ncbi:hypothetical protein ACWDD9_31735 [Kitasatospora sp. NPDC001119]